eukprot:8779936-Pyramimonas_sp.AAC.1
MSLSLRSSRQLSSSHRPLPRTASWAGRNQGLPLATAPLVPVPHACRRLGPSHRSLPRTASRAERHQ